MINKTIGYGLLAALMCACGPTNNTNDGGVETGTSTGALSAGRVSGTVADDSGARAGGLSGSGTLSVTSRVQIIQVLNGGMTNVLASSSVNSASGAYTIDVPRHDGMLMAQALDASGNVVASAILEEQTRADSTINVQPMTSESSLEATVLLDMMSRGGATLETTDVVDLRTRLDARTAAAVRESAAVTAGNLTVNVHALASGMMAAQATTRISLMAHGVDMTAYRSAETMLAASLNGQLASGGSSGSAQANAQFVTGLDQLNTQVGMDAEVSAATEMRSSAAVRLAVQNITQDTAVIDANARAAAIREGRYSANAMVAVATRAHVATDSMTSLQLSNNTLQNSLAASVDARSAGVAFDTWRTSLHTWFTSSTGLLASVNGSLGGALEGTAVDSMYALGITLDANLATNLHAALSGTSMLDATLFATSVDTSYTSFRSSVQGQVQSSLTGLSSGDAELFTSAMVVASGSFR